MLLIFVYLLIFYYYYCLILSIFLILDVGSCDLVYLNTILGRKAQSLTYVCLSFLIYIYCIYNNKKCKSISRYHLLALVRRNLVARMILLLQCQDRYTSPSTNLPTYPLHVTTNINHTMHPIPESRKHYMT